MSSFRTKVTSFAVSSLLLVGLAACGGGDKTINADPTSAEAASSTTTEPTTPTTPAPELGDDAEKMADALQSAVSTLGGRLQMNEDNDENDLFGRPGQYDQVTFLGDSRLGCEAADDYNNLDTACGVKIERWPSQEAAQARADDIQGKLKDFGLGAEYDYVVGRLVVRASGDFKPSQAVEIQNAASADAPVAPPA